MTPERWQRVEQLCLKALALDAPSRASFLDTECAGDPALRSEVEEFLSHRTSAEHFLSAPAARVRVGPGTRIGAYEILAPIGAGGMGEVYRARDTKLGREVAIKILPEPYAADADRVARFTREAQTLAAVNHPNIAQIYGVEDAGSIRALVMELVDGDDLSVVIANRTHPLTRWLAIAHQLAGALEAAHELGITHRDLKPQNIKIRRDGTVKVLDFGLAKIWTPDAAPGESANRSTVTAATAHGAIIGTPAYMSPQQATGEPVDKRADIWAFGVVLYEMLTGRRPFGGATISETITSVIRDTPDFSRLPSSTPPAVRRLIERCLERDTALRLRDIGEARILLANPTASSARSAASRPAISGMSWLAVGIAALIIAALSGGLSWYLRAAAPAPLRRFELPAAVAGDVTIQRFASQLPHPTLSPDGESIAYVDRSHLMVRALDAIDSRDLGAVPSDAQALVWSPDSRAIAFAGNEALQTVPVSGGPAFVVCHIPASGRLMGLVWQPDGQLAMAVWRENLYMVPAAGGEPVLRLAADRPKEVDFHDLALAPNGGLIIETHVEGSNDVRTELLQGSARTVLWDGPGVSRVVIVASSTALVQRTAPNAGIWTVPWSGGRLDLSHATLIASGGAGFSASTDGALLYGIPAPGKSGLAWIDRRGAVTPVPGSAEDFASDVRLSPDGHRVVFTAHRDGTANVFVRDLTTGVDTQLTSTRPSDAGFRANPSMLYPVDPVRNPSWLAKGDRVLFAAGPESSSLVVQRADGLAQAKPLVAGENGVASRDGRTLLLFTAALGRSHLHFAPVAPDDSIGTPAPVLQNADPNIGDCAISPDGRMLAYTLAAGSANPTSRIFLTAFPGGEWQEVVDENGHQPRFSADGRELVYVRWGERVQSHYTDSLVSVPIAPGNPAKVGKPVTIYQANATGAALSRIDLAPDGRVLALIRDGSADGAAGRVIYVQNWRLGVGK